MKRFKIKRRKENFPGGPMVKTSGFKKKKRLQVSIAGDMRFIPGWGTRIPCAMERSQKKKKKRKKRE